MQITTYGSRFTNAIHLLEENQDKINWLNSSRNPDATHLFENNEEKNFWTRLSRNPSIFKKTLNYGIIKERLDIFREELMMKCMHPNRLERWIELGGDIDDF